MKGQPGLFDVQERLKRLSDLGDQLETYGRLVDFEVFRPDLVAAVGYSDGLKGGRPPFDVVRRASLGPMAFALRIQDPGDPGAA